MLTNKLITKLLLLVLGLVVALSWLVPARAEKQLTIAAPGYEKTITLDEDPELIISYTPNGMKINFANLNMKVVCIEDPSADGLCRLQAYDGSTGGGGGVGVPPSPAKPSATAGDGVATLTWAAPADNGSAIVGYKIDQTSPTNTTILSNTNSTNTSYTVSGLTNGTAYTFAVAAINGSGLGYMSPSSDAVTPTASGGGGGGSDLGSACNSVPANVNCSLVGEGVLASGAFTTISIPRTKTLTFPFSIDSTTETGGQFRVNSFFNVDGTYQNAFFEMWISDSPAGSTDLNGTVMGSAASTCYRGSQYAEFALPWSKGSTAPSSNCYLGTSNATGLIWVNMRFKDFATGQLLQYGSTSFFVE